MSNATRRIGGATLQVVMLAALVAACAFGCEGIFGTEKYERQQIAERESADPVWSIRDEDAAAILEKVGLDDDVAREMGSDMAGLLRTWVMSVEHKLVDRGSAAEEGLSKKEGTMVAIASFLSMVALHFFRNWTRGRSFANLSSALGSRVPTLRKVDASGRPVVTGDDVGVGAVLGKVLVPVGGGRARAVPREDLVAWVKANPELALEALGKTAGGKDETT